MYERQILYKGTGGISPLISFFTKKCNPPLKQLVFLLFEILSVFHYICEAICVKVIYMVYILPSAHIFKIDTFYHYEVIFSIYRIS